MSFFLTDNLPRLFCPKQDASIKLQIAIIKIFILIDNGKVIYWKMMLRCRTKKQSLDAPYFISCSFAVFHYKQSSFPLAV